jgi:hypothetical protein
MQKMLIGCVVAAAVMFVLGFFFFATPIGSTAYAHADYATLSRIQAALADLPQSGAYAVPDAATAGGALAYERGPIAVVHVVKSGFPVFDPLVLVRGLLHYFTAVLFIGLALLAPAEKLDMRARRSMIAGLIVGTNVFSLLADPVWYRLDWTYALYVFVANTLILMAGAMIVARWFIPRARP